MNSINFLLICSVAAYFSIVAINFDEKITALEKRPKLELTCSIKDNQGRYVCRYVEIEEN